MTTDSESTTPSNFIRNIIDEDLKTGKNNGQVVTRFPPEPNGFLHIGHAKSICLNFGLAADYEGRCHLRFDDTNPSKEEVAYVDSIMTDVRWLGFDWGANLYYTSDYFEKIYDAAVSLIKLGKAYVCDLTPEEMREYRGTLTEPGRESPQRNRPVEENLDIFQRMRDGEFADGACVLRAKIDMTSGNINMRDPIIYRVLRATHHRTGDKWCIYPMYDFAHSLSDAMESITHSICTLEFEDHRPLYDWILETLATSCHPQQIEFARLNLTYTVMSKRKLLQLVNDGHVSSWDDPRMPTISGFRRRGYTAKAIRTFCERIGVAKRDSMVDTALLEFSIREDLNELAPRALGVLRPLKVVIENYPEDQTEEFDALNHPGNPEIGTRKVPFARELYIERDDYMEDAPKKFFRMSEGREVRFRFAYLITCREAIKDANGEVVELRCTYDPETRGGSAPDGRKVKGTIHWVSASHAVDAEVRLYDRLFTVENPAGDKEQDFKELINPQSLTVLSNCKLEPSLAQAQVGDNYQFERMGYFCLDNVDSRPEQLVFNRTVTLRDTWAKMKGK